jgi:hypothetical protein
VKKDEPLALSAIHSTLGLKFNPLDKANEILDCLENLFTCYGLCDENHQRQVEPLLESEDNNTPETARACDVQKLIRNPKTEKGLWN